MKTLDDKAKGYADKLHDEYYHDPFSEVHLERMVDECKKAFVVGYKEAMRDVKMRKKRKRDGNQYAYRKGAAEALAGQWRKPDKELPKDGQMVLIREYHRSAKNGRFVNHIREFMFFEQYGFKLEERKNAHLDYRVTHWMPIPGLPNDK